MTQDSAESGADKYMDSKPVFAEHHVPREQGRVYARDYKGADPAFVLMHGLPDNLHIWDDLIPYLVASGRRVVSFDFLGFGASDKPPARPIVSSSNSVTSKPSWRCWALARSSRLRTTRLGLQR